MQTSCILLSLLLFAAGAVSAVALAVRRLLRRLSPRLKFICPGLLIGGLLLMIIGCAGFMDLQTGTTLFALLLLSVEIIVLFAALICRLLHRGRPKLLCRVGLGLMLAGLALFIAFLSEDLSTALLLIGLVLILVLFVLLLANLIFLLLKRKNRALRLSLPVCLAVCIAVFVCSSRLQEIEYAKRQADNEIHTISVQTDYDFEVKDGDTPLEVPLDSGFEQSTLSGTYLTYRKVYDCSEDALLLEDTDVTADMCLEAIRSNPYIAEDRKELFCDFVNRIDTQYPDADLSILYNNLRTLQVVDADSTTMLFKTLDSSAYACYVMKENTIYLPENVEYVEGYGNWDFQTILHEFCHVCRESWFDDGNYHCRLQFDSDADNILLEEAMNSAFSCSLLNYYEPDIAYQMPSNYLRIMLECMDNYTLSDYLNHSDCYFLSKLDEASGYTNYAQVIWKLITLQREDWDKDRIDISAEEYEPIYDFLCELYYGKYLTEDMSREEALALADELAEKAGYDCPEDYKFEADYFRTYMERLLESRG